MGKGSNTDILFLFVLLELPSEISPPSEVLTDVTWWDLRLKLGRVLEKVLLG